MAILDTLIVRLTGDGSGYQKMMAEANALTQKAAQETQAWRRELRELDAAAARQKATDALAKGTAKTEQASQAMAVGIGGALAAVGGLAVKSFADFDQAMTTSTSVMGGLTGLTQEQKQQMSDLALTLSTKGAKSATSLAESYYFLASAGLDAEQSMQALPIVMRFSTAGAFDMAKATEYLAGAQAALGLQGEGNAERMANMSRIGDVLARVTTLAQGSTQQFAASLTRDAGASMASMGIELEEGVAVLAAFHDRMIQGELAGNTFGRMLRLLAASAVKNKSAHEQLGFSVFDAAGNMRPLADIIENLETLLGPMSAEMKTATLNTLGFKTLSQKAILPLIGSSRAIRKYHDELKGASGYMGAVATRQAQSFTNQMKVLWNNVAAAAIQIGQLLAPAILSVANAIKSGLQFWMALSAETKLAVVSVGLLAAGLLTLGPVLALAGKFGGVFLTPVLALLNTLRFIPGLWQIITGAAGAFAGVVSFLGKGLFLLLNPIALIKGAFLAIGAILSVITGPFGVLFAIVTAIGVGIGVLVHRMGGFLAAWEFLKGAAASAWGFVTAKAMEFWNWIQPVLRALGDLAVTVWGLIMQGATLLWGWVTYLFGLLYDFAVETWYGIFGEAEIAWDLIRQSIVDAIQFAEFTLQNFGQVADFVWSWVKLEFIVLADTIMHFFLVQLPAYLKWFVTNLPAIFLNVFNFIKTVVVNFATNFYTILSGILPDLLEDFKTFFGNVTQFFKNLIKNIAAVFTNLPALIKGKVKLADIITDLAEGLQEIPERDTQRFRDMWKPLTEGFKDATAPLPKIAEREIGVLEQTLRQEFEQKGAALGQSFEEFQTAKLADELQAADALLPAEEIAQAAHQAHAAGDKVGKSLGQGFGKGAKQELQKSEAVLAGSAEAVSRLTAYQRALEGVAAAGKAVEAAQVGSPDAHQREDANTQILRDIRDGVQKQANRTPLEIDEVDFD